MTPSPSELHGKLVALLIIEAGENDNEEWAIAFGVAEYDGMELVLDRGKDNPPFVVRDEWVSRIRPVPDNTEETFEEAEYYLSLAIAPLPPEIDPSEHGYEYTGLKWPHAKRNRSRNRRRQ